MTSDVWKPDQYDRFAAERRLPFDELVDLCEPLHDGGLIVDLGCGTGTLTAELGGRLGATEVIGIDSSEAMLAKARSLADDRADLRFEAGDLARFGEQRFTPRPSLILSNAALHWVDHHDEVIARWRSTISDGGQLAIQVPTNHDHPAYALANSVAEQHPDWFPDGPPPLPSDTVLAPEHYAQILHGLGAVEQHVALRVFTHELPSTGDVVEWLKSTTLNPIRIALDTLDRQPGSERPDSADETARFDQFCQAYREQLIALEGYREPYLFTFKRILMWARF